LIARFLVLLAAALLAGCGYHVSGRADLLPKNLKTIAIPSFENLTTRYKLADKLPAALTREFISRTRYSVIAEPGQADAILRGAVMNYMSFPVVSDQATGRATGIQVIVNLQLTLVERQTGNILFQRPGTEFRQRYEIAIDQSAYFEESELALTRLSRDVARDVVSSILEAF
jgi:outer membrane lipopolysaccharide assembly protein LptE/RlpB